MSLHMSKCHIVGNHMSRLISQALHFPVILDAHACACSVQNKRVTCPYPVHTNSFRCLFVRVDVMTRFDRCQKIGFPHSFSSTPVPHKLTERKLINERENNLGCQYRKEISLLQ